MVVQNDPPTFFFARPFAAFLHLRLPRSYQKDACIDVIYGLIASTMYREKLERQETMIHRSPGPATSLSPLIGRFRDSVIYPRLGTTSNTSPQQRFANASTLAQLRRGTSSKTPKSWLGLHKRALSLALVFFCSRPFSLQCRPFATPMLGAPTKYEILLECIRY